MRFFSALALASFASAASVQFWTLDAGSRTIYFTGSPGNAPIAPVKCDHTRNLTVVFPSGWQGNFYAIPDGHPNVPGMLGEVKFGGFGELTFFDVSAIVNSNDIRNVRQMWPLGEIAPMSGCNPFPCNNVYMQPDDVQTKATRSSDLMCTLGEGTTGIMFAN